MPSPRGGRERVLLSVKRRRLTRDRRVLPLVLAGGTDVNPGVGVEGTVMSHWDEILEHWGIAMSAAGRSRGTIRTYMCHARKIRKLSPEGPESVTTDDLRRILANPKWTPETRKSVRTVFGTFFRWLHGEEYIEEDPALRLDIVSTPAGVARPAPEEVIRDRRDVVLEHVGTAHNDGELAALTKIASEHLRPGQESRLLLEAIRSVYRFFGFEEALGDEAFKQLVLARIVEPTSKADTVRVLDELGVAARHRNSLQSALERINRDGYRGEDRHSVFPPRPVGRGPVPCLVRHDDLVLQS